MTSTLPVISSEFLAPRVRVAQIIVAALVMGCVAFTSVTLITGGPPAAQPMLSYVALGMIVPVLIMRFVVPGMLVSQARRALAASPAKDDDLDLAQLWGAYQTSLIVAAAMIEGVTFFVLVSYMVERQPLNLGVAVALILILASHFPTTRRVRAWLESQHEQLRQERAFKPS